MKILQVQDWKINAQVESTILFSIQFEVSHMPIIFYSEVSFIQNTKYKSVKSKEEKKKKKNRKKDIRINKEMYDKTPCMS